MPYTDNFSTETLIEVFDSQEAAQEWMASFENLDDGYTYSTNIPITVETIQTTEQKPDSELIHSIEGIIWLRQADEIDISFNAISDFMPLSKAAIEEAMEGLGDEAPGDYRFWFGTHATRSSKLNTSWRPFWVISVTPQSIAAARSSATRSSAVTGGGTSP